MFSQFILLVNFYWLLDYDLALQTKLAIIQNHIWNDLHPIFFTEKG